MVPHVRQQQRFPSECFCTQAAGSRFSEQDFILKLNRSVSIKSKKIQYKHLRLHAAALIALIYSPNRSAMNSENELVV